MVSMVAAAAKLFAWFSSRGATIRLQSSPSMKRANSSLSLPSPTVARVYATASSCGDRPSSGGSPFLFSDSGQPGSGIDRSFATEIAGSSLASPGELK